MRMGVREICDVVFRPLTAVDIGNQHFDAGQPVLYLDTAKTSSLEGASTTVYAQGGKGNPRLIGWDGEKTLTFTVEDALISPESFSMLSGAGIVRGRKATEAHSAQKIYTHQVYDLVVTEINETLCAELPADIRNGATIVVSKEAPIYATILDSAGAPRTFLSAITPSEIVNASGDAVQLVNGTELDVLPSASIYFKLTSSTRAYTDSTAKAGNTVRIDCYTMHTEGAQEIQIDAESFAGYYYIEADTLFRDEATGQDLPAQFIIPRGKIQSNFTFTMANSGDPSTFTFTIDAFPAFTKFNKNKKVMAALQIVDPTEAGHNYKDESIIGHAGRKGGTDIYGEGPADLTDVDRIYTNSIFDTATTEGEDTGGGGGGNTETEPPAEVYINVGAGGTYSATAIYYTEDDGTYTPADSEVEAAQEATFNGTNLYIKYTLADSYDGATAYYTYDKTAGTVTEATVANQTAFDEGVFYIQETA